MNYKYIGLIFNTFQSGNLHIPDLLISNILKCSLGHSMKQKYCIGVVVSLLN